MLHSLFEKNRIKERYIITIINVQCVYCVLYTRVYCLFVIFPLLLIFCFALQANCNVNT